MANYALIEDFQEQIHQRPRMSLQTGNVGLTVADAIACFELLENRAHEAMISETLSPEQICGIMKGVTQQYKQLTHFAVPFCMLLEELEERGVVVARSAEFREWTEHIIENLLDEHLPDDADAVHKDIAPRESEARAAVAEGDVEEGGFGRSQPS